MLLYESARARSLEKEGNKGENKPALQTSHDCLLRRAGPSWRSLGNPHPRTVEMVPGSVFP